MKFSVNWLREFVELPAKIDDLVKLLTFAGVEIEGIEERGGNFDKVVIGQIKSSTPHPNADRLSVCQVDDGSGQPRQIVCGAKNYKTGDKVPVALPGATLPNGLKIKVSKLRGVESQGMLCSPSELKISEESDGLLILSPEAPVGAPFDSIFESDTILDVQLTPNRGDLLSHFGLAREIAALRGASLQLASPEAGQVKSLRHEGVKIFALRECPFYSARRIENVKVGPSPEWLRAKIEAAGIRAINNIVDISNFVMLELGQPTHAFDADKLRGAIHVRLAREGEKFLALDGKTYSLTPQDLVIADEERAVGIGGVMGGEETGVTESTRNVLLEAAYFLPSGIRRTARELNLPSDASYRFERGVDPMGVLPASQRAADLMRELAGGAPAGSIATAGAPPSALPDVTLRYQRCHELLGISIARREIIEILERFGLTKVREDEAASTWQIPSHRDDLRREVDLIEEVIRAHGLEKIPASHRSTFSPQTDADRAADFQAALRQRLVARGLYDVRTSALIPRAAGALEVRNPLSEDHVALRPSLLPGLLEVLERNQNLGATNIRLFELGRIFLPPRAEEKRALGLLFSGETQSYPHWRGAEERALDFFDLKSTLESLPIPALEFRRAEKAGFSLVAEVVSRGEALGFAGRLSAEASAFVAQIDLEPLIGNERVRNRFVEIEKFPSVTRDIAMFVPPGIAHAQILRVISESNEPLLAEVRLFDLFQGKESAPAGGERKSLAYTLTYRDKNRTLTNDEVTVVHGRIRERLQREIGAELRE